MIKTIQLTIFVLVCIFLPGDILGSELTLFGNILFSSNSSGNWDLWSVQPDGKGLKQITRTDEDELFPAVSPDGKQIAYADGKRTLRIMTADGKNRRSIPLPAGIYAHPAWHPAGTELAFVKYTVIPSDQGELWRIERREKGWHEPERISPYPPMRIYPSYSPDGLQIAYAEFRRDRILGVVEEIGIADLKKGTFRLMSANQADTYQPVWSPDGAHIAYVTNKTGNYDIWIFDLKNGTHRALTRESAFDGAPSWSSDGDEIVFVSTRSGNRELWVISLMGDQLRRITDLKKTCMNPFWIKQAVSK